LPPRAEPPSKGGKAKAAEPEKPPLPIIDAFSDDSDKEQAYSSSEEEGEVYIRGRMGKKRKVAAREELPRGREPVSNPLTLKERICRKESRVANRLEVRRNNLSMIRLLMRGVADKLHSHRHIKHFRSDLHRYIDALFDGDRHKGFAAHGLKEENLSTQALNPKTSGPTLPETAPVVLESEPVENSVEDSLPFANLKIDVDSKGDGTNYQTEIMVEIEKRAFWVIADSGATSSGVNLKVVRELNLVNSTIAHRLSISDVFWACGKGA
jgi:hypothetical protein